MFQEKAKKVGLSKAAANETLIDLITIVFKYYHELGLNGPIYSLNFLVSQKGSWIVQKAIQHQRKEELNWEDTLEAEAIRRDIYSDTDSELFIKLQNSVHDQILQQEETKDD